MSHVLPVSMWLYYYRKVIPMKKKPRLTQKIPTHFSEYILLNPAFPVETVYQLLMHSGKNKAMMIIRGKTEDFADNPSIMFRTVKEPINIKEGAPNGRK